MMQCWTSLSYLGDLAVLLPSMCVMAAWMAFTLREAFWRWLMSLAVIGSVVFLTKLAFMAWGLGIKDLDFIGASGHSTLAAFVWPTLLCFVGAGVGPSWSRFGVCLGLLLALGIGISRIQLRVHSVTEVAAGLVLGAVATLVFLRSTLHSPPARKAVIWLVPLVVGAIWLGYGKRFPSEYLLWRIAERVSPDGEVRKRNLIEEHR